MRRWTSTYQILGILLAAASVISLVSYGFRVGWIAPIKLILNYYDALLRFLLGWAQPYLAMPVLYVNRLTGWHLHLLPQWKHVFVLVWLYFGSTAKAIWSDFAENSEKNVLDSRTRTVPGVIRGEAIRNAERMLIAGFAGALVAGIVVGVIPEYSQSSAWQIDALIVIVPIILVVSLQATLVVLLSKVTVEVMKTLGEVATFETRLEKNWRAIWSDIRAVVSSFIPSILIVTAVVVARSWVFRTFPATVNLPNPPLALLAVFFVSLAFTYYLPNVLDLIDGRGYRNYRGRIGAHMLLAMGGAALFVVANSGLKLMEEL